MTGSLFGRLLADESGATAVEYALITSMVSMAALGAFDALGEAVAALFEDVADALETVAQKVRLR